MKKTSVTILIAIISLSIYGQQAYKQTLNHIATITFPDKPFVVKAPSGLFYSVTANNKFYLIEVATLRKSIREMFTRHSDDTIYASVINGALDRSRGKILYKKHITVNGLDGVEFCYSTKVASIKYYRYHQAFYFNNTLILDGIWSRDSLRSDSKALKDFFNTLKPSISEDDIRQGNTDELAYTFGYIIGIVLIIVVIVLLGLGVVFIIKKFTYK